MKPFLKSFREFWLRWFPMSDDVRALLQQIENDKKRIDVLEDHLRRIFDEACSFRKELILKGKSVETSRLRFIMDEVEDALRWR